MSDQPTKPILSRITIGRLYNLGNYEHIRYELSLDVPDGVNPKEVLSAGQKIMMALKPIKMTYEETQAKNTLAASAQSLSAHDLLRIEEHKRTIEGYNRKLQQRESVLELLRTLGGAEEFKDAKDRWETDFDDSSIDYPV